MKLVDRIHTRFVHQQRVTVLSKALSKLIPPGSRVLDVGSGDGLLAGRIARARPDLTITGIDVLVRESTVIPVRPFDGNTIPFPDRDFNTVLLVDVLHHADDPLLLLREAARVTDRSVVIKDHTPSGPFDVPILRFMDYVGNAGHGVALPYTYWTRRQWLDAFSALELEIGAWHSGLHLYPAPADWVFGRSLHFVARLDRRA